jgi:hypothetical protein
LYRVKAKNGTGQSDYSNVAGPVEVTTRTMVDEMENFNKIFQKDGSLKLLTTEDIRRAKEDRSRLAGGAGSYIIYKLSGKGSEITVDYFVADSTKTIGVSVSSDMNKFSEITTTKKIYVFEKNDYEFFDAVTLRGSNIPDDSKYLKVSLDSGVQISRIEIRSR